MRKKILLFRGCPASGKTFRAKEIIHSDKNIFRVERDCIREMLFCKRWTGNDKHEKLVTKIQAAITEILLQEGCSVLSTDTNLSDKAVNYFKQIAERYGAGFEIDDSFGEVPLETCIERDSKRPEPVGAKVIKEMYDRHQRILASEKSAKEEKITQNVDLPKCALVDVDGTVTLGANNRSPYEWHKVDQDLPRTGAIQVVKSLHKSGCRIIFMSGRDSVCRQKTIDWLEENVGLKYLTDFELYMRPENDMRKDSVVKKELYMKYVHPHYFVELVLDDRDSVVSLWRRDLGFTCLQVDYGNF